MPSHVLKALQKYAPKDSLQIMTPSQTSDILHNNVSLIEQLKPNQKIELLRYLIKGIRCFELKFRLVDLIDRLNRTSIFELQPQPDC